MLNGSVLVVVARGIVGAQDFIGFLNAVIIVQHREHLFGEPALDRRGC